MLKLKCIDNSNKSKLLTKGVYYKIKNCSHRSNYKMLTEADSIILDKYPNNVFRLNRFVITSLQREQFNLIYIGLEIKRKIYG